MPGLPSDALEEKTAPPESRELGVEMFSGFLQGWLMEMDRSLSHRHLGHGSDGVRTTKSTRLCQPSLARAALRGQRCVRRAPCWQTSPCVLPAAPWVARQNNSCFICFK